MSVTHNTRFLTHDEESCGRLWGSFNTRGEVREAEGDGAEESPSGQAIGAALCVKVGQKERVWMVALCKRACMIFTDPLLLSLSLFLPPSLSSLRRSLCPLSPRGVFLLPLLGITQSSASSQVRERERGERRRRRREKISSFSLTNLSPFSLSSLSLVNCVRTGVLSQVHEILWK